MPYHELGRVGPGRGVEPFDPAGPKSAVVESCGPGRVPPAEESHSPIEGNEQSSAGAPGFADVGPAAVRQDKRVSSFRTVEGAPAQAPYERKGGVEVSHPVSVNLVAHDGWLPSLGSPTVESRAEARVAHAGSGDMIQQKALVGPSFASSFNVPDRGHHDTLEVFPERVNAMGIEARWWALEPVHVSDPSEVVSSDPISRGSQPLTSAPEHHRVSETRPCRLSEPTNEGGPQVMLLAVWHQDRIPRWWQLPTRGESACR